MRTPLKSGIVADMEAMLPLKWRVKDDKPVRNIFYPAVQVALKHTVWRKITSFLLHWRTIASQLELLRYETRRDTLPTACVAHVTTCGISEASAERETPRSRRRNIYVVGDVHPACHHHRTTCFRRRLGRPNDIHLGHVPCTCVKKNVTKFERTLPMCGGARYVLHLVILQCRWSVGLLLIRTAPKFCFLIFSPISALAVLF